MEQQSANPEELRASFGERMKILAMLYMLTANGPVPVAAYFTQDARVICQATAAAQNATEEEEYYCE